MQIRDVRQRNNGLVILYRVGQLGRQGKWTEMDTRRTARLSICCAMTESELWIYANKNNAASLKLYHEQIGQDHASVGLFQQQVPMWGTTHDCMDPISSTDKFVNELLKKGLTRSNSKGTPWSAIQAVQVSAFADGSNYHGNWDDACKFVAEHRQFWAH